MNTIFKAYDIRGVYPDQLNAQKAERIGYGFARFVAEAGAGQHPLVIGSDARSHSPTLKEALIRGIAAQGTPVIDLGLCTTPMLYCAVGSLGGPGLKCGGGAMVTASHNAAKYNGFKLCREGAIPISSDSGLVRIRELAESEACARDLAASSQKAKRIAFPKVAHAACPVAPPSGVDANLWARYWEHLGRFVSGQPKPWRARYRVAFDPANGMGCLYAPLLRALGLELHAINDTLDCSFPAHEANPIKPENIRDCEALTLRVGAQLGIAFDGDADRVALVDEKGHAVANDILTGILALPMLAREPGAGILYDVRSSRAIHELIVEHGGRPIRERVGHSFMKATLRKQGAAFGGELSGHYYFRDNYYADSAMIAALAAIDAMDRAGQPLSQLASSVTRYAQSGEINFEVADKERALEKLVRHFADAEIDRLDGVTVSYPDWWFNARPSNTEPLLRLNVEAKDATALHQRLEQVQALIG